MLWYAIPLHLTFLYTINSALYRNENSTLKSGNLSAKRECGPQWVQSSINYLNKMPYTNLELFVPKSSGAFLKRLLRNWELILLSLDFFFHEKCFFERAFFIFNVVLAFARIEQEKRFIFKSVSSFARSIKKRVVFYIWC